MPQVTPARCGIWSSEFRVSQVQFCRQERLHQPWWILHYCANGSCRPVYSCSCTARITSPSLLAKLQNWFYVTVLSCCRNLFRYKQRQFNIQHPIKRYGKAITPEGTVTWYRVDATTIFLHKQLQLSGADNYTGSSALPAHAVWRNDKSLFWQAGVKCRVVILAEDLQYLLLWRRRMKFNKVACVTQTERNERSFRETLQFRKPETNWQECLTLVGQTAV
jgi:hypothetical protein